MRFCDILVSEQCKPIFDEISIFTSKYLTDFNNQLQKNDQNFPYQDKDIFDIVWGTIELSKAEICLLDSPLIQRLRNIRQLGFADYVYCNASYTRFAHTIGVVEVAGRISKKISNNKKIKPHDKFDITEIVRLAAIFHDVGHMFHSHVSESFFMENTEFHYFHVITNALSYFNENISSRASLHEMFSVMAVNTIQVKKLLQMVVKRLGKSVTEEKDLNLLIEYISGLIVGVAIDKDILPYSNIIKGSIDADRMDYLSRDSIITKVPLAVDIPRLLNKITVVNIKDYVPPKVWNDFSSNVENNCMAIQYSAQRLIWQLATTRSILYQTIYFHHKKLTVEGMFKKACEIIFRNIPPEKATLSYIMSLTDQVFSEYFKNILFFNTDDLPSEIDEAYKIIKKIRDRDLYKRVASFSQDAFSFSKETKAIYVNFINQIIEDPFSEKYNSFITNLTNEYYKVLDKMKIEKPDFIPVFMFIKSNLLNDTIGDIPIDFGNGPYKMAMKIYKDTPSYGEENKQKQYYLVTDQINRLYVYIALETVLLKYHKLRLLENSSTCAKFLIEDLNRTKETLFGLDYYNDSLFLVPDKLFERLYDRDLFLSVVSKYHTYDGFNNSKITEPTLFIYLKQYLHSFCNREEIELLINGVLKLLAEAYYIDRSFFADIFPKLKEKIVSEKYTKKYFIALGKSTDSGKHLSYYMNDTKDNSGIQYFESINTILDIIKEDDDSCIIFFDDASYSGKQVVSIFQELMGIPSEKRATNETHTETLHDDKKECLKRNNVILSLLFFNKDSENYIKTELGKLGITHFTILYVNDLSLKIFDEKSEFFKDKKQKEIVKKHLEEIGYQVLKSAKKGHDNWNDKRLHEAALGYNDAQQLVIYDFNVPTFSLTALWTNGKLDSGLSWKGLFQRTEKDNP
jgi:HD superfamily phosphohydrolase